MAINCEEGYYDKIALTHGTEEAITEFEIILSPFEPVIDTTNKLLVYEDCGKEGIVLVSNRFKTIADLVTTKYVRVGEVVELLGYYELGDGAGHKRIIEDEDDGTGVEMDNGKWANIIIKDKLNTSYFGVSPNLDDNFILLQKVFDYAEEKNISIHIGIGSFKYSKTILVDRNKNGTCPTLVGSGVSNTKLIKTSNEIGYGSVDAFFEINRRSTTDAWFSYKFKINGLTLTSDTVIQPTYGIHCHYAAQWNIENVVIDRADISFHLGDAWLMNFSSVILSNCNTGFRLYVGGTSFTLANIWVDSFVNEAYYFSGLTYSNFSGVAADNNSTDETFVFRLENCKSISINGIGAEAYLGGMLFLDNSIVFVSALRTTKLNTSGNDMVILKAINNSLLRVTSSDFLGIYNGSNIHIEEFDDSSSIVYDNIITNSANSSQPITESTRRPCLYSKNAPMSVLGFEIINIPIHGSSSFSNSFRIGEGTIKFISGVLNNLNYEVVFLKTFWNYTDFGANNNDLTDIGVITDSDGAEITTLRCYYDNGMIKLILSSSLEINLTLVGIKSII